ncbi:glycosyl hydrolase [Paraburkholderia sp. Tr-20389]|uniref:WD40/YVTN/BNR-like repeat-containing protein n=1 Tax=Paraburkholderia sp. Tr-20389 TaxID=2703903 RepID=UPI00197D7A7E|nr:YCF48-related protein [Paraburkholderia sp. Tr-20389]MBN3755632.1 glycosyl hydrolase [Paraburkholderia sp. Tr-20389]
MHRNKNYRRHVRAGLASLAFIAAGLAAHAQAQGSQTEPSASAASRASTDPFVDPLDSPAVMQPQVAGRPVMAIARAGTRIVAVGMRGLIAISDDEGRTWGQVGSPVRSDLLALSFPTALDGWVVGHDGVILHTADGGRSWTRQFDGRMAATTLVAYYKQKVADGDAALQPFLDQVTLNYNHGPSLPLLSVSFRDAQHGMAVGPFGMAIATEDGGKSWRPVLDRIDNPQFLHLNAVLGQGADLYLAAEKGTVFRLDAASGRFQAVNTGYAGSFFGMAGDEHALYAFGLRGTIYGSSDRGATWSPISSPLHGSVTSAMPLASGHEVVFVTAAGEAALYDERTRAFRLVTLKHSSVLTGVLPLNHGELAITSLNGPAVVSTR